MLAIREISTRLSRSTLSANARCLASAGAAGSPLPEGFTFLPVFFNDYEQRLLLTVALSQLDVTESIRVRRLQNDYRSRNPVSNTMPVEGVFLPEHYYTFHEGHYDNVIRDYREMSLSSWPESRIPGLTPLLDRLRALCPSKNTQTHLLHLASSGEISPHIDNVSASGKWIMGVSLGAARTLRMESPGSADSKGFDIVLSSGSVYLQRDDVRYRWKHAILPLTDRPKAQRGQRLSIMIRGGLTQGKSEPPRMNTSQHSMPRKHMWDAGKRTSAGMPQVPPYLSPDCSLRGDIFGDHVT